jgi:hypothetical protein
MQAGPVLTEINWRHIPTPILGCIVDTLRMEHPEFAFHVIQERMTEKMVIFAAEKDSELEEKIGEIFAKPKADKYANYERVMALLKPPPPEIVCIKVKPKAKFLFRL